MNALTSLTNEALERRVKKLGRIRSAVLVELVLGLAEVHRRRIHVDAGCDTVATYCTRLLGEERNKAWRLGMAAEAVVDFPLAGELLKSKQLSVTALIAVKKALTRENHEELLRGAIGMTEEEARVFASEFKPVPRRHDSLRVVHFFEPAANGDLASVERYELRAILTPDVRAQLERVKAALSHSVPDGNLNDVLSECFRLTLEACERRKLGRALPTQAELEQPEPSVSHTASVVSRTAVEATSGGNVSLDGQNREGPATPRDDRLLRLSNGTKKIAPLSRYIPAPVRQAVWIRDGACCSYVGKSGDRCRSTYQLEFDHWLALSLGGDHTVENVRLLCSRHNRYEAERVLGKSLMRKYFDHAA